LRLRYHQLNALWSFLNLTPPYTRTRFAIQYARFCGDKVATITINPCHGRYLDFGSKSIRLRNLAKPVPLVKVANPNNPDIDLITMKQVLMKAAELGNPKLGAEAYGLYTVSKL
jgi:hypothetical protein